MGKTVFMFPGQGAQYVGMGKDSMMLLTAAKKSLTRRMRFWILM